jgi:tetratricopeptide (TPR) repeat protein
MEKITAYLIRPTVNEKGVVRAWKETVLLPTYETGEEEKNPVFSEKRVYQGSSGVVYPYPVIEKISDEKTEKPYNALFLENEYLKIMILPELGGRIQMAYDKTRKRHFVYYNQVIKPALVGLTGPWISGGIEFNWPQHHRPSTFLPVDYCIESHGDGSFTVWCSEVERMFRTKGMHGFTLYPGKAYLEIRVKVYNRTIFPQTFLWWANPAVAVNERYYSVFPPDVHAVYDHGKRDVSNFPIATGIYYKQDYSAGVDISKYKNIPVPTSYMAVKSKYDFVGGYEEGTKAGLLHVADHCISPGKKQWTWGCGDFGEAWDRNLTDEDGPYIELMTGVYTDNQPDFSWLQPGEEKSWVQYFMPYAEVGYVKNATRDAIVNVEIEDGKARIVLYTTSVFSDLEIRLSSAGKILFAEEKIAVSPEKPYHRTVEVGNVLPEETRFELVAADGKILLRYQADKPEIKPAPSPASAARNPKEIKSVEQLYLTGLHLEQYHHATYNPADYYLEALEREPGDIRSNNAMGLLLMRKGRFADAESHFRKAIETLTQYNPNPCDGEAYYNLGCCLNMQGRSKEAYEAFFKSVWNAAWQDAGYFETARIDAREGRWADALEHVERSLMRNTRNHRARHLKTAVLRRTGQTETALHFIGESLEADLFNMGCRFEKYLITGKQEDLNELKTRMRGAVHVYIEYALDYAWAGMYEEAAQLLASCIEDGKNVYPMVYYALGWFASLSGNDAKATHWHIRASQMPPDKCFPNRIEEINMLEDAIRLNPSDAYAHCYLGNFLYSVRRYNDAVVCWERSHGLDETFPAVMRNLALAYYNKRGDKTRALQMLEAAFDSDKMDARILMELDQLYKKTGKPHRERIDFLEKHLHLVEERDDLCIERITLYNQLGRFAEARELIAGRKFHPWEGGEGKITKQYIFCRLALAKQAVAEGKFDEALQLLHETDVYPHNLGEGKLINAEENDIDYCKGLAYRGAGNEEKALSCFTKATAGSSEPRQAFFYNDQQPDKIYYQGLAWKALGNAHKARSCFHKLIDHGEKHLFDDCRIDYFAVSLPDLAIWEDDLNVRNRIHCCYVMGLGHMGLGHTDKAKEFLSKVLELDVNHQDAQELFCTDVRLALQKNEIKPE